MNVLNISRFGNQIKGLKVIGINNNGNIILSGCGEMSDFFFPGVIAKRMMFYEYDPVTDKLEADIFSGLNTLDLLLCDNAVKTGKNYFLEATDNKVSIVYCDFNRRICERLFAICTVGGSSVSNSKIQLIPLTDRYFAIKAYNKSACEIYIYDKQQHKRYDLLYSENEDMRYSNIHHVNIDGQSYILFLKQGKSDWKMEFYIHQWKETPEFKKYKDEKLFIFPLAELTEKGKIYLDKQYMVAQADENHGLRYHTCSKNCIMYSYEDYKKYDSEKYKDCDDKYDSVKCGDYDQLLFFDVIEKQVTRSTPYHGSLLISNRGAIYNYRIENDQYIVTDLDSNIVYRLPYRNEVISGIINELLILLAKSGVSIYDLKNEKEVGRYYTEDKKQYILPQVRSFMKRLSYTYFENEDLLVLY